MTFLLVISSLLGIAAAQLVILEGPGINFKPSNSITKNIDTPIFTVVPKSRNDDSTTIATRNVIIPQPRASEVWMSHVINKINEESTMKSTSYPETYSSGEDTRLMVSSPAGTIIRITCNDFNVNCKGDGMTFSRGARTDFSDAQTVCGSGTFNYESSGNKFALRFYSTSAKSTTIKYRFQCILRAIAPSATGSSTPSGTSSATVTAPAPAAAPANSSSCTCGARKESSRIVGGVDAKMNEFPWRAGIIPGPGGKVFCGASLISQNFLLTAAHCCAVFKPGSTYYVTLGDHDQSTTSETANTFAKFSKWHTHPQYNKNTQDNDVCLLQLSGALQFSNSISPVCLPFHNEGNDCNTKITVTASGWGVDKYQTGSSKKVLQKVDVPCISSAECRNSYSYKNMVTDNMLCTYLEGKDTCQGDSGGSIDYKNPKDGKYYLLGVVSWGIGCAGKGNPGVYAKTSKYLSWIKSVTNEFMCGA